MARKGKNSRRSVHAWRGATAWACALALAACGRPADPPPPGSFVVPAASPLRQVVRTVAAAQILFEAHGNVADARMAITVPADASALDGQAALVYVESAPWTFAARRVQLGPRIGSQVAVLAGLAPGERVAVPGSVLVDGDRARTTLP